MLSVVRPALVGIVMNAGKWTWRWFSQRKCVIYMDTITWTIFGHLLRTANGHLTAVWLDSDKITYMSCPGILIYLCLLFIIMVIKPKFCYCVDYCFQEHILGYRLTVFQFCLIPASCYIVSWGKMAKLALRHPPARAFAF